MATQYALFPDRREPVGALGWPPDRGYMVSEYPGGSVELLMKLHAVGWHYPVVLVFRESGQDRWSLVTIPVRAQGEAHAEPHPD